MTDRILVSDLLLRGLIGVNPSERTSLQDILINIELEADLRPAGASDDIDDAVNYRTIAKRVVELVNGSAYYLVEKLAAEVAALCLQDPRVLVARVRIEKPGALRFARSVGVEIERRQGEL
jgi:FolB domain-containing protein